MKTLYLVQHGKPMPKEKDPDRPLSEEGRGDVNKMASFLKNAQVSVTDIFHSGKTRASQTAEIFFRILEPAGKLLKQEGLSPMDNVKIFQEKLQRVKANCMIVGHLPHLAALTSQLVTGQQEHPIVSFQQGAVVCLRENEQGWTVAWMIEPDII